jgi:hypothetical protein
VRLREEEQSFNILDVDAETVSISLLRWTGERYKSAVPTQFRKTGEGWRQSSQAEADAAAPA